MRSDRRYRFVAERSEVWDAFTRVDRYRTWWPWLQRFDGTAFAEGARWHCVVKPQLPYSLEFVIVLDEVVEETSAHANVSGDIEGWAKLELLEGESGSELRLRSELIARAGPAKWVDAVVPSLARRGHNWVLDNGIRQFRQATRL